MNNGKGMILPHLLLKTRRCYNILRKPPANKLKIDEVRSLFNKYNKKLISSEYNNSKEKLKYICLKHTDIVQEASVEYIKSIKNIPCKYCREEIRIENQINKIENKLNGHNCKFIECDYKNTSSRIYFICNFHKDKGLQNTSLDNMSIKRNKFICWFCGVEHRADNKRKDSSEVKKIFIDKNYEMVGKYVDYDSKIEFICNVHPDEVQEVSYNSLKNSKHNCKFCYIESQSGKRKLDFNYVKSIFEQSNFIILDDFYINAITPIKCYCVHHNDKVQFIYYGSIQQGHKCRYCFYESNMGENNSNWNGGVSTESKKIRDSVEYKYWREEVFIRDNYTCQACGQYGNRLHAHHIENFSSNPDKRLDINNGITLCGNCHDIKIKGSFHNTYGVYNNTLEQLEEYIKHKNNF